MVTQTTIYHAKAKWFYNVFRVFYNYDEEEDEGYDNSYTFPVLILSDNKLVMIDFDVYLSV